MQEAYKLIGLLATNDVPALILGERGVGKHISARTIHFNSHRRDRPFIAVNCRIILPEHLDAEIFGSDAAPGPGKLERADGGTMFLEEIQHLPVPVQSKLFRYLTEHAFERAGGVTTLHNDVRIIAATTDDLSERLQQGLLSIELFDALRIISIELPPLRKHI